MTTQTAPDTDSVDLAEFRSTVRAFANAEIHPGAAARDESKEFPAQLVKRLGQQDLMGISVPEEFGGLGLSTRTQLVAIEEVARTDAALASIYTAHYLGLEPILVGGSEEQKHRWLPQLASGELLAGFDHDATQTGRHHHRTRCRLRHRLDAYRRPTRGRRLASLRLRRRRISNAARPGRRLASLRIEDVHLQEGTRAWSCSSDTAFVRTVPERRIPRHHRLRRPQGNSGRISYSEPQDKMGIRSAPTYTVYLDDVVLPLDSVIGTERSPEPARTLP